MNIVYAPRALRDLESIAAYFVERSPSGAINVLSAIKSRIDTLSFYPHIGPIVDDVGHRRLAVIRYPYVIFYRIAGDELLILHIRHTSRRPIDPARDL
jgi:addiction module RelE/StbE family toxin